MKEVVRLKSGAKINLGLGVLNKRHDGYHNVDMIMQTLDLCDFITFKKNKRLKIKVFCNKELDCKEEDNIAFKAAKKFLEYVNIQDLFIDINIEKNIPIRAGLAGGSGNAAAVLVGLDNMLDTNLSIDELTNIGKDLGADVPFCIRGGAMRATGTGTDLEKINIFAKYIVLIVKPKISISTKDAYGKIDFGHDSEKNNKIDNILVGIERNDAKFIAENLFNDLESSLSDVQRKEITYIKNFLITLGALNACMSGSGPSVYGIFDNEIVAKKCFESIKTQYKESFLCRPVGYGVKIL